MQLYAELMSATSPIGNGLIGMLPDPRDRSRSIFFSQRGFYTEAAPGDPVYMILGLNPGTPDPEEVTWLPLSSTARVGQQLDLMYRLLKFPRKGFFRNLPTMIEELLGVPRDEIFKRVIYTNLAKQSTQQLGPQKFETQNNQLVRDGLTWLQREIVLWQPKGVLVLGEKARKALSPTNYLYGVACAFVKHPSYVMGLNERIVGIRKARLTLGLAINAAQPQHSFERTAASSELHDETGAQRVSGSTQYLQAPNRAHAVTRGRYPLDAVIRVLVTGNPKRPGTAAYTKFAAFIDGQTVAEYLAAPGNGKSGEITWCLRHEFIRLDEGIH
jgi:hypothetical protein